MPETRLPPLIVLLGPTAVGKTELSLNLCRQFGGEVICADSRQIYRHMDIGTAKPTPEEQQQAPHHLFDIRNPDEPISLAQYQQLAFTTIDDIHRRQCVPFLVGGSALYIRAVVQGLRIPEVPPNPKLRQELENVAATEGWQPLFQRLQELDPVTAATIDRRNARRLIRALEIVITTGKSKSELEGSKPPPYRVLQIGLERPREQLYERIDRRVEQMVAQGLVEETADLLARGYAQNLPAMSSLGYREIGAFLRGELTQEAAIERIQIETHRFVRHQSTWFRKMQGIHWFPMDPESAASIDALVNQFLNH
ncbi:MAG: tRNA (adenosine(37)-N6)-dimethylallyltransferase MiaA [Caldilineaceae bacterium]|nr:tRNA (adenosine(37)-N6)-dimethylallyltransferase MiaA [Caldilineaceae bacterium]